MSGLLNQRCFTHAVQNACTELKHIYIMKNLDMEITMTKQKGKLIVDEDGSMVNKYEVELYKKLIKSLNKKGFHFKDTSHIRGRSDLIDAINRVIVEVKLKEAEDGVSQVLYTIAKEELKNFLYIGLADKELFHVFKTPESGNILTFAKSLDEKLLKAPSSFSGKHIANAMVVLGKPIWAGFWHDTKDDITKILDKQSSIPFIADNIFGFHRLFGLYGIRTTDIISAFTDFDVHNVEITKNRIIISRSKGDPIVIKYSGEMKFTHKWIFEKLRIPNIKALEELRQTSDRLQTYEQRASRGAYYTEQFLSMEMGKRVLKKIDSDFIIDPFAGAGSLLIQFINKGHLNGWVNDYDENAYSMLSADYGSIGYKVTCEDIVKMRMEKILDIVKESKNPLFITNPPFNSSSGKKKIKIDYGNLSDQYGRGNQIYPTMGKVIEIMKNIKKGYLAFFCPMSIFCEKKLHMKFLTELLKNFTFVEGYIWSGKHFNDVRNEVSISFTLWKFGGSTNLEDIQFDAENYGLIGFKRQPLLKDGWKYNTIGKKIQKEIGVTRNDTFNNPNPKMFAILHNNGSELITNNVKKPLDVHGVPDELVYALWSTSVGQKSIIRSINYGRPMYMDGTYVHLPDFNHTEAKEILAYAMLNAFIAPDYTNGNIGFVGARKIMKFGKSKSLNDGARYLFKTYGNLPVGDQTISEVLDEIKNGKKQDRWFQDIVREVSKRLDKIGYWDYIPLPKKNKKNIDKWIK